MKQKVKQSIVFRHGAYFIRSGNIVLIRIIKCKITENLY